MTDELLQRANALHKQLEDLENKIQLVEDMHHCDNNLQIRCEDIGRVSITADDDGLKDDILDVMLDKLNTMKEEAEDAYRLL